MDVTDFFFILHGDVYKHALYTLGFPIFIHIKQMKAKLCKYISYGFNRKESMATSSINEMSSAGSRPAKPFPDQLQAQYLQTKKKETGDVCNMLP